LSQVSHKYAKSLFIFRRDLRLDDNTGLIAALHSSKQVIPCFIFDPRQIEDKQNPYKSNNALQFMIESIIDLDNHIQSLEKNKPYNVGSKKGKSTALVIPHRVVKEYKIDTSTVFLLQTNNQKTMITLKAIPYAKEKQEQNVTMPANESSPTSTQQASLEIH
jgi:deoxyribodipyrimidine photolyase